MKNKLAIIDIGSNSIRMNLIRYNKRGMYQLYDQLKETIRLSEGLESTGLIQEEAYDRLSQTLEYFMNLLRAHRIDQVYTLGTASFRRAQNREEIIRRVNELYGLDIQVISGAQEARLDFQGVHHTIDAPDGLIIDIGGASTEIILYENFKMQEAVSLPYGSVSLSERTRNLAMAKALICEELRKLPWLSKAKGLPIIGLGGTIRTIAKVDRAKKKWPLSHMHHYTFSTQRASEHCHELQSMSVAKLRSVPGVSKKRADILKRGLVPYQLLLELGSPYTIISMAGIREGFFFEELCAKKHRKKSALERSIQNIQKRWRINQSHAKHVGFLATELFELLETQAYYRRFAHLLKHAAALHDVGLELNYYAHHQHSYYMILNAGLEGISDEDLVSLALLAGAHRDQALIDDVKEVRSLVSSRKKVLDRLSEFLIFAERMDRSESGRIVSLARRGSTIEILYKEGEDITIEKLAAKSVIERLEKRYHVEFVYRCVD